MIRVKGDPIEWGNTAKAALPKFARPRVTENLRKAVTEIAARKRGRPRKANARRKVAA